MLKLECTQQQATLHSTAMHLSVSAAGALVLVLYDEIKLLLEKHF